MGRAWARIDRKEVNTCGKQTRLDATYKGPAQLVLTGERSHLFKSD